MKIKNQIYYYTFRHLNVDFTKNKDNFLVIFILGKVS